jgi:hypothetical protein
MVSKLSSSKLSVFEGSPQFVSLSNGSCFFFSLRNRLTYRICTTIVSALTTSGHFHRIQILRERIWTIAINLVFSSQWCNFYSAVRDILRLRLSRHNPLLRSFPISYSNNTNLLVILFTKTLSFLWPVAPTSVCPVQQTPRGFTLRAHCGASTLGLPKTAP